MERGHRWRSACLMRLLWQRRHVATGRGNGLVLEPGIVKRLRCWHMAGRGDCLRRGVGAGHCLRWQWAGELEAVRRRDRRRREGRDCRREAEAVEIARRADLRVGLVHADVLTHDEAVVWVPAGLRRVLDGVRGSNRRHPPRWEAATATSRSGARIKSEVGVRGTPRRAVRGRPGRPGGRWLSISRRSA